MSESSRQLARDLFTQAMQACTVEAACARLLHVDGNILHAGEHTYNLAHFCDTQIISIGKAGATLFDAVRPLLSSLPTCSVISAPSPPTSLSADDLYFHGGHPLPDRNSLAAAEAALDLLHEATEHTLVLFLISGGASAMLEKSLDPGIPFDDLIELYRQLIGCGAPIQQINTVRKHLSAVKGGQLAAAAGAATKLSVLVSDVPANALDALASGPTLPDSSTIDDTHTIVREFLPKLPQTIRAALEHVPETPKATHSAFSNANHLVLLDNEALLSAAREAAEDLGFAVTIDNACDDWPYERAADYLLARAKELAANGGKRCLLSGGEVTVTLPASPGIGGRNQQIALYAARHIAPGMTLLSAGSDGIDGSSTAAGAVVDSTTLERARYHNLDALAALEHFDAGTLFATLGDALVTGPSGNNLRDIRIMLIGVL
jgi:glycerate 2-kinase